MEISNSVNSFRRLATSAAFASLFAYAVAMVVAPAAIKQIERTFDITITELGMLFPFMMAGFFIASVIGGRLSDRVGKLPVILAGSFLMTIGLLIFAWANSFFIALIALFVAGMGGGAIEGLSLAVVSDIYDEKRRTRMMIASQAVFSFGAIMGPLGVAALLSAGVNWRFAFIGAAGICVVTAIPVIAAVSARGEKLANSSDGSSEWRRLAFDPLVLRLSIGIMLYVGAELGQANWLAAYFKDELNASAAFAAASVSSFWIGIGIGRIIATWAAKYLSDISLIRWSLGLAAIVQILMLLTRDPILGFVSVVAVGLCLGPVWPTIVACAGAAYPRNSGTVIGMVAAAGCLGGAIFPVIIGAIADVTGMTFAFRLCVLLIAINLINFAGLRCTAQKNVL